ncbi:hypothetical protein KP509_28G029800 [Ceratopteris richardii]|uniref:Uncharacterized protein n=1 Tax=Ceratopteris richardii TaxID=49495 RepID=A0A8T2RAP9_CERRI|nr:hypothetical protein KP509_28G029800 [Ceratopteris richardii]
MYAEKSVQFFNSIELFVHYADYQVPSGRSSYGILVHVPSPCISSLDWDAPDHSTVSSFLCKIKFDIQKAMSAGRISRRIKIQWFLPIHVFVACFKNMLLQKTKTMWLNRRVPISEIDDVLGREWDSKEVQKLGDIILCKVSPNSLSISYQICRQSLVLGYDYRRWKKKLGLWIALDSEESCPEFELEVLIHPDFQSRKIIVTANWNLRNVRELLEYLDEVSSQCRFSIDDAIVNIRSEKSLSCISCLPPRVIKFQPLRL